MPLRHIVAILDLEAAKNSDAAAFLKDCVFPPDARTAIVTHAWGKTDIRPSSISSLTLLRRSRGLGD